MNTDEEIFRNDTETENDETNLPFGFSDEYVNDSGVNWRLIVSITLVVGTLIATMFFA